MDRTKHFSVARKNSKVVGISGKIEGKAFLAEATYSVTSLNNAASLVCPFQLALRPVII